MRIGDKLTFRIQIPEATPYGIFARSCVAMAKDARSTFEIVDEHGCPVDNSIFPSFSEIGNALESSYEAFRFTESYGVIFQCNVKYCIGRCEPVSLLCPTCSLPLLIIFGNLPPPYPPLRCLLLTKLPRRSLRVTCNVRGKMLQVKRPY